jgi:hypothetical protein
MMRLDVEGLANTFNLSEGAPEQLGSELIVIEERFLIGVLGRRLLPLLLLLLTRLSSSSSSLRPRFDGGRLLDAISSFSR